MSFYSSLREGICVSTSVILVHSVFVSLVLWSEKPYFWYCCYRIQDVHGISVPSKGRGNGPKKIKMKFLNAFLSSLACSTYFSVLYFSNYTRNALVLWCYSVWKYTDVVPKPAKEMKSNERYVIKIVVPIFIAIFCGYTQWHTQHFGTQSLSGRHVQWI